MINVNLKIFLLVYIFLMLFTIIIWGYYRKKMLFHEKPVFPLVDSLGLSNTTFSIFSATLLIILFTDNYYYLYPLPHLGSNLSTHFCILILKIAYGFIIASQIFFNKSLSTFTASDYFNTLGERMYINGMFLQFLCFSLIFPNIFLFIIAITSLTFQCIKFNYN